MTKTIFFYIDTSKATEDKAYLNNVVEVMKNQNKALIDKWEKNGFDVYFFPVNGESSRIEVVEL